MKCRQRLSCRYRKQTNTKIAELVQCKHAELLLRGLLFSPSLWAVPNMTVPNIQICPIQNVTNSKCDQFEKWVNWNVENCVDLRNIGAVFSEGELTRWREGGGEAEVWPNSHPRTLTFKHQRFNSLKRNTGFTEKGWKAPDQDKVLQLSSAAESKERALRVNRESK